MNLYSQKTKTGCLFDCLCTSIQKNRSKIKKEHGDVLSFFKFNYLKYGSFGEICNREGINVCCYSFGFRDTMPKESIAVLGVNLAKDDFSKPLHSVFYDGKRVWEPWTRKFLNVNELKIVYAIRLVNQRSINETPFLKETDRRILTRKNFEEKTEKKLNYIQIV
jgi:hypothetical protein